MSFLLKLEQNTKHMKHSVLDIRIKTGMSFETNTQNTIFISFLQYTSPLNNCKTFDILNSINEKLVFPV